MKTFPVKTAAQLGAILRGFRVERGLTQVALAAAVGVSQKAISIAETHPERLALKHLLPLLGALQVDLLLRDRQGQKLPRAEW